MSVRILYFPLFSSDISPIAIPAAGETIGTPPSISASDDPHTEAIELEPLDPRISDTIRIVYGNVSREGMIGISARSASAPCPITRRPGAPMRPVSPTENGGKL